MRINSMLQIVGQAAQATNNTNTPWWGVPLVAGVFTIFGVLLAQASTYLVDRRKAAREDATRWLDKVLDTVLRYLEVTREYEITSWNSRHGSQAEPSMTPVFEIYTELTLMAPWKIVNAAETLRV